jgi:hypothetical protein
MPRAKRPPPSEGPSLPFRYSSFNFIGYLNAKNVASNFVKSESQSYYNSKKRWKDNSQLEDSRIRKKLRGQTDIFEQHPSSSSIPYPPSVLSPSSTGPVYPHFPPPPIPLDPDETNVRTPLASTIILQPCTTTWKIGRGCDPWPREVMGIVARRVKNGRGGGWKGDGYDMEKIWKQGEWSRKAIKNSGDEDGDGEEDPKMEDVEDGVAEVSETG